MKIIKFIIPSLLLFLPIGVFAEECKDYTESAVCKAAATNSGCYWSQSIVPEVPSECNQCFSGEYSTGIKCESCTAGHYCVDGVQKQCPAGTYNAKAGSTSVNDCTQCSIGTYSGSGASSCTDCPAGTYSDSPGASSCTDCPAGTYNANKGSSSVYDCTPCPAGKYSVEGASSCDNECTGPSLPNGVLYKNYSFKFTGGGSSATSCPWSFSCESGKNIYPTCSPLNGMYSCVCISCGAPYDFSNTVPKATTISFDGSKIESSGERVCPGLEPLKLSSSPTSVPEPPVDNSTFSFFVKIEGGKVKISSAKDGVYGDTAEITNVPLSTAVNYKVSMSVVGNNGRPVCKFETDDCGSYHIRNCTVKVSDSGCKAKDLISIVGSETTATLNLDWSVAMPLLITTSSIYCFSNDCSIGDEYIELYGADNEWYEKTDLNGYTPPSYKKSSMSTSRSGYNCNGNGNVPFLGYVLGEWHSISGDGVPRIRLKDFEYDPDCSGNGAGALSKDSLAVKGLAEVQTKVWQHYRQVSCNSIGCDHGLKDVDMGKYFIVGLYSYPPCSPGCYCPNGKSTPCVESLSSSALSPFYSERGSDNRSDCYLKSDVVFKEGDTPVTPSVKRLLGLSEESSYKTIRLGE